MTSVIESIHQQMQDRDADLPHVVPRAVFLSSVLRQKPVTAWLKRELDGYSADDPVPPYRHAVGATLAAWMPGQGWIEAPVSDSARQNLSHFDLREGLPDLHQAYRKSLKPGGQRLDIEGDRLKELQTLTNLDTRLSLAVPTAAFARVVHTVRIAVLLWTEQLMKAQIVGQGMVFSDEERAAAAPVTEQLDELLEHAVAGAHEHVETAKASRGGFLSRLIGMD